LNQQKNLILKSVQKFTEAGCAIKCRYFSERIFSVGYFAFKSKIFKSIIKPEMDASSLEYHLPKHNKY